MNAWVKERIGPAPHIAVEHAGSGEGVLFLHGIGGNKSNWHDQLPAFGRDFHAIAWDARGYGDSDDYDGPLAFGTYADDVVRVLDHFGIDRVHLVGLSMGGWIAFDFAARHAGRLKSLVLCNTQPGPACFPEAKRSTFVSMRRDPLVNGKTPDDIAPVVAKTLAGRRATPPIFERLVDSMRVLHPASYIKCVEAVAGFDGSAVLPRIAVPTLVVAGEDDRFTTVADAEALVAAIPGARLVVFPETGHLSNIESAEGFNAAVLDFLRPLRTA
jgi:3-oxoadipate enol-lactonase